MLYYEFHKLKPEYETLTLSVTEIEKWLNPQPANRQIKDPKKKANTFWVWHIVEDIVWTTISQWEEEWLMACRRWRQYMNPDRMKYFTPSWVEDKQFQWLYDWLEQIVEHVKDRHWVYDLRNARAMVEIDYSWYKILLSGECDWWIDGCCLWDCKTAKQKWDPVMRQLEWCYQARYYSWMQMLAHPEVNEIDFNYRIFTKQKKIQFQEMPMHLTREWATEFVKTSLFEYLKQLKKWDIQYEDSSLDRMWENE